MNSTRKTARIAGLLYLLMAVAAAFSLNIPSGFIVRGEAAATADKIASSQLFYRLCVVSDLASQILFVFLVLVLYQLLKGVNKRQAALMVALVLVQVPMAFTNMLVGMVPLVLYWTTDIKTLAAELQRIRRSPAVSTGDRLSITDKAILVALRGGAINSA